MFIEKQGINETNIQHEMMIRADDFSQAAYEYMQILNNLSEEIIKIQPVFISYVRENKGIISTICEALRNQRINYWLDRDDIEPGKFWKIAIKEAINRGSFFLSCFSHQHNVKSDTFMNEEILLAIDVLRKKPFDSGWFIPIKLDECVVPNIPIGANFTLTDIQFVELYKDWNEGMSRVIDRIKAG